jgi:hypothetical protein
MRGRAILIALGLFGCSEEADIRDFYFPVRELTDGLIYEYENTGTLSDEPFTYWYYLGVDLDTALYLSATRYADGTTPDQVARERITNSGVNLEELTLFVPDSSGRRQRVETDIRYDRIFSFLLNDGKAVGYQVFFESPGPGQIGNLISLDRVYRGDTSLTVTGETVDAIVFDLYGQVSQRDAELGDISPAFSGYEIYARDLGLVEFRRDLGAGGVAGAKLVRRIPMPEYLDAQQARPPR